MGAVLCAIHGTHPGVLCCDHVREAAEQSGADVACTTYHYDVLGDKTKLLEHLLCATCAGKFNLEPSQLIPEDVWGRQDAFPYVCPTCVHYLAQWSKKHNKPLQLTD